jgi:hypothetical protein
LGWTLFGLAIGPQFNMQGQTPIAAEQQLPGTLDPISDPLFSGGVPSLNAQGAGHQTLQMPMTLDLVGFEIQERA